MGLRATGSAVLAVASALMMATGCASQPLTKPMPTGSPQQTTSSRGAASPQSASASAQQPASTAGQGLVTCDYPSKGQPAKPVDPPPTNDVAASGTLAVTLNMTEGPVVITMDRSATPCAVNSFESLVKQGYFTDTSCHRLVDQGIYILQCGDPTGTGRGGPGYRMLDELTGKEVYSAGVVAMANSGPDTSGSQFFIVWADSQLPPAYTVVGTIDETSLKVVTTIASRGVSAERAPNPISPARIEQVTLG